MIRVYIASTRPSSLEVQFSPFTLNTDGSIMLVKRCFRIFVGSLVYGMCAWAIGQNAQLPKPLLLSKIATDGDLVTVPVMLNGKKSVLVVDTGAYSTTLDKTLKLQLTRAVPTTATDKAYAAPGDTATPDYTEQDYLVLTDTGTPLRSTRDCKAHPSTFASSTTREMKTLRKRSQ